MFNCAVLAWKSCCPTVLISHIRSSHDVHHSEARRGGLTDWLGPTTIYSLYFSPLSSKPPIEISESFPVWICEVQSLVVVYTVSHSSSRSTVKALSTSSSHSSSIKPQNGQWRPPIHLRRRTPNHLHLFPKQRSTLLVFWLWFMVSRSSRHHASPYQFSGSCMADLGVKMTWPVPRTNA